MGVDACCNFFIEAEEYTKWHGNLSQNLLYMKGKISIRLLSHFLEKMSFSLEECWHITDDEAPLSQEAIAT